MTLKLSYDILVMSFVIWFSAAYSADIARALNEYFSPLGWFGKMVTNGLIHEYGYQFGIGIAAALTPMLMGLPNSIKSLYQRLQSNAKPTTLEELQKKLEGQETLLNAFKEYLQKIDDKIYNLKPLIKSLKNAQKEPSQPLNLQLGKDAIFTAPDETGQLFQFTPEQQDALFALKHLRTQTPKDLRNQSEIPAERQRHCNIL